jgi:hypothetical protein
MNTTQHGTHAHRTLTNYFEQSHAAAERMDEMVARTVEQHEAAGAIVERHQDAIIVTGEGVDWNKVLREAQARHAAELEQRAAKAATDRESLGLLNLPDTSGSIGGHGDEFLDRLLAVAESFEHDGRFPPTGQ